MELSKKYAGYTILIIEDDAALISMYTRRLAAEGFSVISARDGKAGFDLALKRHPHLILLDIRLPGMTGFEMLKKLRGQDDWGAHVPVIFLTNLALSNAEESADIESTEPAHYLVKSNTNLNTLVEKIGELVTSRQHTGN